MDYLGYEIFLLMSDFIGNAFDSAMQNAYVNSAAAVAGIGSVVMAIWFTLYGMRMAYGLPGHTMSDFMWRAGKAAVVLAIIAAATTENMSIQNLVFDTRDDLVYAITNDSRTAREQTESKLGQLDMASVITDVFTGVNASDDNGPTNLVLTLIGQGTPTIVGGVLLLLNELAIRIGIAVGPLMLFGLLFDSTKDLFFSWVRLLLASMLNMAILAVVVAEAANLMIAFGAALVLARLAEPTGVIFTDLQTSAAQAGFGIMLSALIYTVPQMAARFFGGGMMVGAYNLFAGMRPPGGGSGAASGAAGGSSYAGVTSPVPGQAYGQPSVTPPMPAPANLSRGAGMPGAPTVAPGALATPPVGSPLMSAPSGNPNGTPTGAPSGTPAALTAPATAPVASAVPRSTP